ncbi:alpha/beta fold hydrolase [Paraburkholderia sp. J76]|uniref:alpha/beta fold hydrolase n=1 Tax=Paraburkholderia sp. J76 TaxID=2805439 RepID=UPI002ABE6FF0|nr:alpha/beta fold hydrolase [Paraburkholderia sp. J76]
MKRRALLLVPGMLNDRRVWQRVWPHLTQLAELHVADVGSHDSIEAMADAAVNGMPEQFCVAGFSMGGYVAIELAKRYKSRVTGIALIGTSARPESPRARSARASMLDRAHADFDGLLEDLMPSLAHPSNLEDGVLRNELLTMMRDTSVQAYARQINALIARADQREFVRTLAIPTCIVHGVQDQVVPPALGEELVKLIPGARSTFLQQCGHLAPLECPDSVAAAMSDWIATCSPLTDAT